MTQPVFLLALLVAALGACSGRDSESSDRGADPLNAAPSTRPAVGGATFTCGAAHDTPVFTRPADDGVALDMLLEGAAFETPANSDWRDAAAGSFCGNGKQLMLLRSADFALLGASTPHPLTRSTLVSDVKHPWRALAAGNLDADANDEIVALRNVTAAGVADVVVGKVNPKTCALDTVTAQATVGGTSSSDWIDVAVGNFDGKGKQIAMLRSGKGAFTLARVSGSALTVTFTSDLDGNVSYPWKAIAAGDLDGDGIDELVAARQVGDRKGTTVNAYKWNGSTFARVASSTFGNTGNSAWASMVVADFNGDGHAAIALVKNAHSNFAILDLAKGGASLRTVTTGDLDSVSGQDWRALAAADWLSGDQGAAELIPVRAARLPYRDDIFVYGNAFHRVPRDTALANTKAQWDEVPGAPVDQLATWLAQSNSNTMTWSLTQHGDYTKLVDFLEYTKSYCVDGGQQLRVWVQMGPPSAINPDKPDSCWFPEETDKTPFHELDFFASSDPLAQCGDYLGWASILGLLAKQYPHLVALELDDYMNHPDGIPGETLALMQSRMRAEAPWMNLVLQVYYDNLTTGSVPDISRTVDNLIFYFRNNKRGECLNGACGENSVWYAPEEIAEVAGFLPAGRKLQVGTYWGGLFNKPTEERGTARYDYDLMRLLRNLPGLGGVTAYPMQAPVKACDEFNFLKDLQTDLDPGETPQDDSHAKFCALQRAYGEALHPVTHTDLTTASGAPLAAGDPSGYEFKAHGVQNVVYRATDNHAHELWRTTSGGIGHSDLTSLAPGAPAVLGDVKGYVFEAADTQNAVYRGTDGNVHGLWWTLGAVHDDNLTGLAGAPAAAGTPYPYVFTALGMQNVLYRGTDGHAHGLYWNFGPVGHDDLTNESGASGPAGDPFGYVFDAYGVQNALYRANDGRLHGLWWSTGAVRDDPLSSLANAPGPASDPRAYVATTYGIQYAVYRGTDNRLHGLYWSTGAVGHDDLTYASHAPLPLGNPTGYFHASDGTHHVVYRSSENHVRALSWTIGAVADDDLTLLGAAPLAAGDPSAYVASDGTERVIYRGMDAHLHELSFR